MNVLARLHDSLSRAAFLVAAAALAVATALYVFEIVARYVFDAPTTWSSEAANYALALLIFLSLPEITRRKAHIAIDLVPEALPAKWAVHLQRLNAAVAAGATLAAGYIIATQAVRQFETGLLTNAANPIPRWWITAVIAFGFIGASLHFARQIFQRGEAS